MMILKPKVRRIMKCHPMATNIFVKFKEQAANLASAAAWST